MKTAVVYWSATGNTEAMASAIAGGLRRAGAEADLYTTDTDAPTLLGYEKIALGCPSMGDEVLEESEFQPLYNALREGLAGKKVALFGSYGWGDGQWMRDWNEDVTAAGAQLFREGFIQNYEPDVAECEAFGEAFAAF